MFGWVTTLTSIVTLLYSVYKSPQFKALLAAAKTILSSSELQGLFDELVRLFRKHDEPVFFEKMFKEERFAPLREQTGLTAEMARTLCAYAVAAECSPCDDKCDDDCEHKAKELVVSAGLPPLD